MEGIHAHFTVRTSLSFLLLILLQTSTEAQMCSAPRIVQFDENNEVGAVVVTITLDPGVTLAFNPPPADPDYPFRLDGDQLIAAKVLDYETQTNYDVAITCTSPGGGTFPLTILVFLVNVNDHPPVFAENPYRITVNEMTPVDVSVARIAATDVDNPDLYYTLTSTSVPNPFKLQSRNNPDILVETPLEYDKVKSVELILTVQDTETGAAGPSFTASTTILVTIVDVDNRPPWFQPCVEFESGGALICQSSGYTGVVSLNEQETGTLPLKPGPLHAIDGDNGINEAIMYSFLGGDAGGLFQINSDTGDITMLKPADVLGTISLTVLAAQRKNSFQVSTTTVTIRVLVKSLHPPKFQSSEYKGVVSAVGTMAVDLNNKESPLRIIATDDDYAATGGLNPHITYQVTGSNDFSIVDGYLFMTKDLPEETLSLQVVATDTINDQSATAQLSVQVTNGLTTTSLPQTTDSVATTSVDESTTNGKTTNPTTIPSTTSEISSMPTEGSVSTAGTSDSTAPPVIVPSGEYGTVEMAAVGATLGVLLFICLVVIGVLAVRIQRGKADWRKIYEASKFQSSLGKGSVTQKEGIQYTNEAFENDEDGYSTGSGTPKRGSIMLSEEPGKATGNLPVNEAVVKSSLARHVLLRDDASEAGSDKTDSDKEVKPILTKERRMDEGYKSVWFKEDIDPNAKEEVVIIPDSREHDSEDEDEDDNPSIKTPRVVFNETDLDSGLGVKMEDPAESSEDDDFSNVHL
ncbi:cadherin-related family member 5 isoform X1 [Acanthopagrus latus]|uniref:cadherin-related family member 5 isoform X1 n=1 Tax=Acanthopagrus latus TaxID=8177 RepID=UPI00187C3B9D|nr:cadherin-related family member 5 isoform X1 [Acanthopagrus latus]